MGGLGMGGLQMGGGRRALWGWASQLPAAMIEVGVWLPVAAVAKVSAGGRQAETMGENGGGGGGTAIAWLGPNLAEQRLFNRESPNAGT